MYIYGDCSCQYIFKYIKHKIIIELVFIYLLIYKHSYGHIHTDMHKNIGVLFPILQN